MCPEIFQMVDMGGVDLTDIIGRTYPGLYNRILAGINTENHVVLYNWYCAKILIPPYSVSITVDSANAIRINNLIFVYSNDTVDVPTMEILPIIEALSVTENGVYSAPAGVDGYNPVTVEVPTPPPVLVPLSVSSNGSYTPAQGEDGFNSVTVNVPVKESALLQYIQSSGTQYIKTGIYPCGKLKIEVKCKISTPSVNWDAIFGTRNGAKARYTLRYYNTVDGVLQLQWSYTPSANAAGYTTDILKNAGGLDWHTFIMDGNNFYIDGVLKKTFSDTPTSDAFPYELYLFNVNSAGTSTDDNIAYLQMSYCRIWDYSGQLIRDFLPVKDNNGIVCFYDRVTQNYFYNQGTGNFIAGPEIL